MREIRQKDLRQRIADSNILTDVFDLTDKLSALGTDTEGEPNAARVGALRASADIKMKLMNKVLPDLKAQEIAISGNLPVIEVKMTGFKKAKNADSG